MSIMGKKKCVICKVKPANKDMSTHHLKPKWGKGDTAREHPYDICISCHQNIHRLFHNGELYELYNTLPRLKKELQHRLIQEALEGWFRNLNGTVAPIPEQPPCKRKVEGESPFSAFQKMGV